MAKTKWPERSLDELGILQRGKSRHRPRNAEHLYGGPYPFIQTADVTNSILHISNFGQTYSEAGLAQSKMQEKGTLCIVNAGVNTGDSAILNIKACFPDSVIGFVANKKRCDVRFIKYYLDFIKPKIRLITMGATQDNLSVSKLLSFKVPTPPIQVQEYLASILTTYDELIENNTRRIQILEEMAQRIYTEWFVYFRFPGHEKAKMVDSELGQIPSGWRVLDLQTVADVTYGFAFKSKQFNTDGNGMPVIRIRDVLAGTSNTFSTEKASKKYLVENGDILVGMDGDFHMGFWVGGQAYLVQRVARFLPKGIGRFHLFLSLWEPIQHFNATISGTTVAHLGHKHIKTIKIKWPQEDLIIQLNSLLEPMLEQILNLRLKNIILRQTRDLLLPKLISGEIDVSDILSVPEEIAA